MIRNFCIISHIDHGKSTLADRLLELTGTIEKRKMREQFLDSMELERERGITIKMQPVRMVYKSDSEYILNLIDTPGHIDFSYEVSRSLAAVEGAVLLVDASQGIQAQTISNLEIARSLGLTIIPVINKIDLPHARISETKKEIISLLKCREEDILEISAKTGQGIPELLDVILKRVPPPPPSQTNEGIQALIFDFEYSPHQGVIAYVRMMRGSAEQRAQLMLLKSNQLFEADEVGIFSPERKKTETLATGEIGYITTKIKEPQAVRVGDTITSPNAKEPALAGYHEPSPVVWASIYPMAQDGFDNLKKALGRLRLRDSAFSFKEESSGALGRGFNCGFLGLLHMEIITERIKREFGIETIVTSPTARYLLTLKNNTTQEVRSPTEFKDDHEIIQIKEPWLKVSIIMPSSEMGRVFSLLEEYETVVGNTENFGEERMKLEVRMPLRELMRDFYDRLKSVTSGYASLDYEITQYKEADVTRLDILVHNERIPAFSRIISNRRIEYEGRSAAENLKKIIPRELFSYKIQAVAKGRIIASESVQALKKNVTGNLYGGDRTRKMKLWQKQKKGKERLKSSGRISLPHEVYIKMLRR